MDKLQYSILSAVNIGLNMLFQWVLYAKLGPSEGLDSYIYALALPQFVFAVFSNILFVTLVPFFSEANKKGETRKISEVYWGLIIASTVISIFSLGIFFVYAKFSNGIIESQGFDVDLALSLEYILAPSILFVIMQSVQLPIIYSNEKYAPSECMIMVGNLLGTICLWFSIQENGIFSAAWANLIKAVTIFCLLSLIMERQRPCLPGNELLQELYRKIRPALSGSLILKTDVLIDRQLLLNQPSGSLSMFYLAQQLVGVLHQVFAKIISQTHLVKISRLHVEKSDESYFNTNFDLIKITLMVMLLFFMIMSIFVPEIVGSIFEYKNFSSDDVHTLQILFVSLAGFIVLAPVSNIYTNIYYSQGDTKTPIRLALFTYAAILPTKFIAVANYGLVGFAFVISINYVIDLLLQRKFCPE